MKSAVVPFAVTALLLSLAGNVNPRQVEQAQSDSSAPASHAAPASCLILKHKGTVGRRLMWTALTGIPIAPGTKYDYVDNINVQDIKVAYTGKELQALQAKGVHVIVLNNKYTTPDLDEAYKSCHEASAAPAQH